MKLRYALLLSLNIFGNLTGAQDNVIDLSQEWETIPSLYNANRAYCRLNSVFWTSGVGGYVIVKDGEIVAERYSGDRDEDSRTLINSSTKSFAGLLLGHLEYQGLFTPNTTLGEIFANDEDWEGIGDAEEKKTVTMEELLTFTSGLSEPSIEDENFDTLQRCLSEPYDASRRGTFEYLPYNQIFAHVILRLSGSTPGELAVDSGIFPGLGIGSDDYEWLTWGGLEGTAQNIRTTPRVMAKLGQLYLQNGRFSPEDDYTLLSPTWVEESIKARVSTDTMWDMDSYGYHWTTHTDGRFATSGASGNDILVFPEENVVVAMTVDQNLFTTILFKGSPLWYSAVLRSIDEVSEESDCRFIRTPFDFIWLIFGGFIDYIFSYHWEIVTHFALFFTVITSIFRFSS